MEVRARDGTRLHVEECGSGTPVVFAHEFGGDHRSWEPQLRYLGRYVRCIVYGARGYAPSEVLEEPDRYSQGHARDDLLAVLDGLQIPRAHLVGLSMGAFAALHLTLGFPDRVRSLVLASCGWGARPEDQERFRKECETAAAAFESHWAEAVRHHALGPTRVQFRAKDPRGWEEFAARLAEHSPVGQVCTLRGVQMRRPSLWEMVEPMRALTVPTLVMVGDEDEPCLEAGLLLKRSIPTAGLLVFPFSGHTLNLEEPESFNRALLEFLVRVEQGRPIARGPGAAGAALFGLGPTRP